MVLHKFRAAPVAVALFAVAALAATLSAEPAQVPRPAVAPLGVAAQPEPVAAQPVDPGTLLIGQGKSHFRLGPDGKKLGEIAPPKGLKFWGALALSPDGTRLAAVVMKDEPPAKSDPSPPAKGLAFKLMIGPLSGGDPKVIDWPSWLLDPRWTPDGKSLLVAELKALANPPVYVHHRVDPTSGESRPLALPDGCQLLDVGRDGKTLLVEQWQPDGKRRHLGLTTAGAAEVRPLADLEPRPFYAFPKARLSPDGKRVLFIDTDPARKDAHKHGYSERPYVLDVATGRREKLADFPENGRSWEVAWSPDGKQVAYTWTLLHADRLAMERYDPNRLETEQFLMVADADGRNAKAIASGKSRHLDTESDLPNLHDWR